jgi:hypothetical protein
MDPVIQLLLDHKEEVELLEVDIDGVTIAFMLLVAAELAELDS